MIVPPLNNMFLAFPTPQDTEAPDQTQETNDPKLEPGHSVYICLDDSWPLTDLPVGDIETISHLDAKREATSVFGARGPWILKDYVNTYKKVPKGFAEIVIDGAVQTKEDRKTMMNLHNESITPFLDVNPKMDKAYAKHNMTSMAAAPCELCLPLNWIKWRPDKYTSQIPKRPSSSSSTPEPTTSDDEDAEDDGAKTQLPEEAPQAKRTRRASIGKAVDPKTKDPKKK